MNMKVIFAEINTTSAAVKIKPNKNVQAYMRFKPTPGMISLILVQCSTN